MCLATSNNLLLVLQDAPKRIFSTNLRSSVQPKIDAKTLFFHPPSPFHGNFCNCNSIGICTASQFQTQLPLRIVNSGIRLATQREATPTQKSARKCAATSCAKGYKAHSLQQTSFAESPNRTQMLNSGIRLANQLPFCEQCIL